MAAKKGKDTLKDLSKFLKDQDEAPAGDEENSDEFLSSKPKTLVNVSKLQDELAKAGGDPDQEFLVNAVVKLAQLEGSTPQTVLYNLVEGVLSKLENPEPGDLLMLSSVQYLSHNRRIDSKLQELLKE
ncbi:MAG TPA: hypothetical protein DCE41_09255 [Cytophagales bacterium]|nr:hypothetical protein [Cytophagales bacterium]HAA21254.1 hypothetical protein [Cytophagales bacterium]HAP62442.1 hypothetical protein [Cytophagales bacterium]